MRPMPWQQAQQVAFFQLTCVFFFGVGPLFEFVDILEVPMWKWLMESM